MNKIIEKITDGLRIIGIILVLIIFGSLTFLAIKYEENQKAEAEKRAKRSGTNV